MFFRTLARATIRHNRAILAIWIIALAVSIPAILQVQKVIVYSETAFNSKSSESSIAQQVVNREFNIQEGSSGVVVISHNDVRGNETRDFTLALNWTLRNDPTLTNIGNITTIYDIYYQLLLGFTSVAHFQLYQIQNATNLANLLEFGIPNAYLTSWTSIVNNAGFNATGNQVIAYNRIANATSWAMVSSLIPSTYAKVAMIYQNLFYKSWNSTFSSAENYNTFQLLSNYSPLQRAQNVTKGYPGITGQPPYYNVTYSYFESLPLDPQTKELFLSTIQVFNMYPICSSCNNWNSPPAVRDFSISTFESQANLTATQQDLIGPIYDLGPSSYQPGFSSLASQLLHTGNIHSYPVQPSRAVSDQFISRDNRTMLVIIDFKPQGSDPSSSTQQIRDDVSVAAKISGQTLSAYVTGAPAFNYDVEIQSAADVERIDPVTVALILIIVGLFFSSLFVPMLPVSAIGLSVGVAFGFVYVIGTLVTSVHFLVLTLLPVSMFGAGSDYCIFLVSRYAEERKAGRGKNDSVERAVVRAGESIATSGATVVIAFGSLAVAGFGMLRSIGLAVMLGISVALIVCLTLVPATLSLLGDKLFWPRGLRVKPPRSGSKSYYHRAAKFTAKHSKMVLLVALAASLPATGAVLYSKTSHDLISQIPDDLGSKQGYIEMTNGFGAGTITPTFTVVETPVRLILGSTINVTALRNISALENSTLAVPGEQQQMFDSMKPFLGSSGKSAIVFAVLSSEPYSDNAIETLGKIRAVVNILQNQNPFLSTSTVLVGGETASIADLSVSSASDYLEMALLVLVGVFIILLVALRSVLTPIRLIFTILLSVSWALAAVVYISQLFFGSSIIWMLPIMLLVIMIGLGLDYDIFLVTRIREYFTEGSSDDAAIENAVEHTGPIITTSGLVTAGAFATMMLSRIPLLQQLGMGIFIVVMLDSGLVRIYLVPSIMRYMKRLNWWAPRIFRRVPVRNPLETFQQKILDREAKEG